jgi:hypothetical protein
LLALLPDLALAEFHERAHGKKNLSPLILRQRRQQ